MSPEPVGGISRSSSLVEGSGHDGFGTIGATTSEKAGGSDQPRHYGGPKSPM
jgi:hypothetical protein